VADVATGAVVPGAPIGEGVTIASGAGVTSPGKVGLTTANGAGVAATGGDVTASGTVVSGGLAKYSFPSTGAGVLDATGAGVTAAMGAGVCAITLTAATAKMRAKIDCRNMM
jgi:carbonic anhydrase/acetyltransferase-like protein (isoleucine patch superfamily)